MKKKILAVIASVLLLAQCAVLFTGCSDKKKPEASKAFGEFSYYGKTLIDYAVKDLGADELKKLVDINVNIGPMNAAKSGEDGSEVDAPPEPDAALINRIKEKYLTLDIDAKFYVDGQSEPKVFPYHLMGTDYNNIVKTNMYRLNDQIIVRSLTLYPNLVDYMEAENAKYKASGSPAPYKEVYSYHTSKSGSVVIKQRAYVEIPATENGGVGCSYRQDIEMVYDSEYKISKWQSSLGIYTTTPVGTSKQGYILEIDFKWNEEE